MPSPTASARATAPAAPIFVGTAGWTLPREQQPRFPAEGTHLQRYAAMLKAAEINTTFYRSHRASTWARWAESVPDDFRFSAKLPRAITHTARLVDANAALDAFLAEVAVLGAKLACLLVQLPPSLVFETDVAAAFFQALRERHPGCVSCEPRHATWFTAEADALLAGASVARVAADPVRAPGADEPGGWPELAYFRLHGSPRMYYSEYTPEYLDALAARMAKARERGVPVWCIFDNTTLGAATGNALDLLSRLGASDAAA
ncbi:MAG TPA: DUF72 domain-containing protein [Longimicrobium sp.]|nr:DUF72 domain-containing protein [Longimicrobium sp.]